MSGREVMSCTLALLEKDLRFEPAQRRVLQLFTPLLCGMLIWAMSLSDPGWFLDPMVAGLSPAAGLLITQSIGSPFLFAAVVYMGMIQKEKSNGSFLILRALPIDPVVVLWSRILGSSILSLAPTLCGFVLFAAAHASGWVGEDRATHFIFGVHFPLIIISLTLLVSTLAVGLGLLLSARQLALWATIIALFIVAFPILYSRRVMGVDSRELLFNFAEGSARIPWISIGLFMLTLVVGAILSMVYRRKSSYL